MIQNLLSDEFLRALGWTLVHSLWQAVVAALLVLLLQQRLRQAVQRYWLAYGFLMLLPLVSACTFALVYETEAPLATGTTLYYGLQSTDAAPALSVEETAGWSFSFREWLEQNSSWIVGLWFAGFGFFLLRLAGSLYYVQQLRRRDVYAPEAQWQDTLRQLAARIACTRPLVLLESALVQSPLTLGYFKPLILLPLGMVNRLTPAEVEAILAHELAHIARRDWLLNLAQAFVDALYYFHPAVWWMSAQARHERENCCDDYAVAITGDRLAYVKTLVALQENTRPATPALALGMAARRNSLLDRVKRILNQQQHKSQAMEKFIATGILLAFIALWGVSAGKGPVFSTLAQIAEQPAQWLSQEDPADYTAVSDSVPKGKRRTQRITSEEDGKTVEMELENGRITRLKIDGRDIAESEFDTYSELTESLLGEVPEPPMPPDAPMPPGFYFYGTPPAAIAPGAPDALDALDAPLPPGAAMSPFYRGKLFTEKDAEGNTILRIEQDGEPTEIVIKNGEVWVGDKKIEAGESLELNGASPNPHFFYFDGEAFDFEAPHPEAFYYEMPQPAEFHFEAPHVQGFYFEHPAIDMEQFERHHEEMARAIEEQERELARMKKENKKEWKKAEKEWKKQKKELEEQEKSGYKELRRAQEEAMRAREEHSRIAQESRRIADEQRLIAREQRQIAAEQRRVADEQRRIARVERERSENFSNAIKRELKKDGLITDANNFSLRLNQNEMLVNGKKQSDDMLRKYLELYEKQTGEKLGKGGSIQIEEQN